MLHSKQKIELVYTRRIIYEHFISKEKHNVPPNQIFKHNVPPNLLIRPLSTDFGISRMLDGFAILDYLYTRRIINEHFISKEKYNVPPNQIFRPISSDFWIESMLDGFAILDYLYIRRIINEHFISKEKHNVPPN